MSNLTSILKSNLRLTYALLALVGAGVLWWAFPPARYAGGHADISFNEDVRPILNENCLMCHGGVRQAGGFSLLFEEEAREPNESGRPAFIPGNPDSSEIMLRVRHSDPEERMPLDHPPLSETEIETLEQWIEAGAPWETHWAYIKPEAHEPPEKRRDRWSRNGIDAFVLDKLETAGLKPAPEADCATLMRRVSLDLTGLPPAFEEVEAFCSDISLDAYEQVVDKLLASPHFGERWAAMWLDLARYADSKGYEKDGPRTIWKYRDWVIDAFNRDLPFDEFTIEQLAGDLLPDPTEEQLLATAFHRNTMNNDEGGTDDEEFRMAAVIDRVNTTWEVWMGTTMACVQCHSHPYDPFTQKEYYEFLAFFNNTADKDTPNEFPTLSTYADSQLVAVDSLVAWIAEIKNVKLPEHMPRGLQVQRVLAPDSVRAFEANLEPAVIQTLGARETLLAEIPPVVRTPVFQELTGDARRETHLLNRGNFLDPLEEVTPDVPGVMPALPDGASPDRLTLARWIVSEENPLTARVMVNRFWEQIFGAGLILTIEDFGTQGEAASHPELLDWLALQFIHEHDWSVKSLLKQIVMSATYRQDYDGDTQKLTVDPDNRLFARGARIRLTSEQIRDQALAVSGLLSTEMYGPSVYPYQPEGIWNAPYSSMEWSISDGQDRHRRGLYTYWRRSAPYPSMIAFDSPSREFCVSRRISTNTPLQALVTLNDPVFVEAAEALARRAMDAMPANLDKQIIYAFQRALVREPLPAELTELRDLYKAAYFDFEDQVPVVEADTNARRTWQQDPEFAALAVVANAILNLDEFIMKG